MTIGATKDWEKDFREFVEALEVTPPNKLSGALVALVAADLNPSSLIVFVKLLVITLLSGAISLVVCPQFGFGSNMALMRFFMQLGPHACSLACGAVFVSLGALLSVIVLRPEELRVIRRTKYLQLVVTAALSLSVFICAGASVVLTVAVFWLFGAIAGGLMTFEALYRLRIEQRYR